MNFVYENYVFPGIGISTTIVAFTLNTYYIVILAWDLVYLANSFTSVFPGHTAIAIGMLKGEQ